MASFTSPTPHFFKIILQHTLSEGKLVLPKKFVRNIGGSLLDSKAILKLPTGKKWEVELKKGDGKVWFGRGWPEFVEFFSLKLGHFLLFRYEEDFSFHVVIFDRSASEIQYPMEKVLLLDESEKEVEMATEYHEVGGGSSSDVKTEKGENGRMKPPKPTVSHRTTAMEKATTFQSTTQNPSFMCMIWPSHIRPGTCLNIPKSFAEMHVKKPTAIILQVSDGRMWSVRCYVSRPSSTFRTQIFGGWSIFAGDNKLQVGDFCVFQMIRKDSKSICLEVSIFRDS